MLSTPESFFGLSSNFDDIFETEEIKTDETKNISKMEIIKMELQPISIPINKNVIKAEKIQDSFYDFPFQNEITDHDISPLILSGSSYKGFEALFSPAFFEKTSDTPKKQKIEETIFKEMLEENKPEIREWSIKFYNKDLEQLISPKSIKMMIKTRCQDPCSYINDRLYSSLKYEIIVTTPSTGLSFYKFILAKIVLTESKTCMEVKTTDTIKGTTECSLALKDNQLSGLLKVQLSNSLSYHHSKKEYRFEVRFFDPSNDENTLFTATSSPFKIFARKPNKKREREDEEIDLKPKKYKN
jgi:hypothetical protein